MRRPHEYAFVHIKDAVIQALCAHLYLGYTKITQPANFVGVDLIRACLDDKSHVSVVGCFVVCLSFEKLVFFYFRFFFREISEAIHRIKTALYKPLLVIAFI